MVLGSHNSFSYLKPRLWFLRPFSFMARCQEKDIREQYEVGVRCFDIRIRFKNGKPVVAHGMFEYKIEPNEIRNALSWIDYKGGCYVRIIHEVRSKSAYTEESRRLFGEFCKNIESTYKNITFWNGRNLYNWKKDYEFTYEPNCVELYSSVCNPYLIDDLYPRWYAKRNNKKNIEENNDCDILLIDFVNLK